MLDQAGPAPAACEEATPGEALPDDWAGPAGAVVDDPLAGSLAILGRLLGRTVSPQALTAGLPLEDGKLTPALLVRSAHRAGLTGRVVRWSLNRLRPQHMPCLLLLSERRACVLAKVEKGRAYVILPELDSGIQVMPVEELERDFAGHILLAQPRFRFDDRAPDPRAPRTRRWFLGAVLRHLPAYGEVLVAAGLINGFALALPLFVMFAFDRVLPTFAEETLWALALGVVAVIGFDLLVRLVRSHFVDAAGRSAGTEIGNRLFGHVLAMKMAVRPNSTGALANTVREVDRLRALLGSGTLIFFVDLPFAALFVLTIAWIAGGAVATIPLLGIAACCLACVLVHYPFRQAAARGLRAEQQAHALLVETVDGIETVKSVGAESTMQYRWEAVGDRAAGAAAKSDRLSAMLVHVAAAADKLVVVAVVCAGFYLVRNDTLSFGALVAVAILANRAMAPMLSLGTVLPPCYRAGFALAALDDVMRRPVERPANSRSVGCSVLSGSIEFRNVSFRYPGHDDMALSDVSFRIEAGERVGIVGRTGSGKTTIQRLVDGHYEPGAGTVLVDDIDLRRLDPADLRANIGVVPQDAELFFGSVRENIAIAAPHSEEWAVKRAARIAGIGKAALREGAGLDAQVGEHGRSLSAGQRQTVAVARALLGMPPVLIMDDPTSAMDETTAAAVAARLGHALEDETLLLTTNSRAMLSLVDRLIVMDGGRVVADGPRDDVIDALQGRLFDGVTGGDAAT